MKPSRNFTKKANANEFVGTRKTAIHGKGVVPYCAHRDCWVLPAGPRQQSRLVDSYAEALAYAKAIDDLINNIAPEMATRLSKAA
jgi:hypothetical protein